MRTKRVLRVRREGQLIKEIRNNPPVLHVVKKRNDFDRMYAEPTRRNLTSRQWRERGELLKSLRLRGVTGVEEMCLADLIDLYESTKFNETMRTVRMMQEARV